MGDHTGTIELHELKTVLVDKFQIEDAEVAGIFEAIDSSHDEKIEYSEFLAAMCAKRIAMHDSLLKQTFDRFDTGNTGFITAQNMAEVLGEDFDGHSVHDLLQEIGESDDAKIDFKHFVDYIHSGSGEVHGKVVHATHKAVDSAIGKRGGKKRTQRA